ncbi:MAG: flagellar hook-associated protein 3 [Pseudomonas sp. PGPPP4]|uniref:flagellar hook-associated protein 3 n=1 Tax=Pseudomonas TaxID=286 RepID=UPI000BDA51A3|nr:MULTISPECIES: flagellar hook-associated protein 3 [Pseudomonas]NMZ63068.1 flagellar hook-associated protein 3 [Pseudomonas oryzihabitans]OYT81977.1 MAG: flagellar hook-associated protein 3 [Pseudomonas sp. PGPPP4]
MRISTSQMFTSSTTGYSNGYSSLTKTMEQISSGVRIQTPADDPVGSARLLQLEQQKTLLTQYSGNMTTATNALTNQESVLSTITNVLQNARMLAVQAGNGSLTDDDRSAISDQLGDIQDQLFSLMNSKDASGNYIFSGSSGTTQPFVKNPDGSYSYKGDQSTLSVQVADTLNLAISDNGWSTFESAKNADLTTSSLTSNPNVDGTQRVFLSQGTVTDESAFNSSYRSGAPYTLNVISSTQFKILDGSGNDVTSEVSGNGTYETTTGDAVTVKFRGAELALDVSLKSTDDSADTNSLVSGYSFSFGVKPETFTVTRSATNTSTAQITGGTVSNETAYSTTFPSNGVLLKFTSATDYQVYALPTNASSSALSSGTLSGSYPATLTVNGAQFSVSSAAASGDEFTLGGSSNQTQNVLDTIKNLRTALDTSTTNDPQAQLNIRSAVASAITNLDNGMNQVYKTTSSLGARQQTITLLTSENQSLSLSNTTNQSSIRDTDMAEATSKLTLQQTMLEAAQAAFAKVSQLSLFDKI